MKLPASELCHSFFTEITRTNLYLGIGWKVFFEFITMNIFLCYNKRIGFGCCNPHQAHANLVIVFCDASSFNHKSAYCCSSILIRPLFSHRRDTMAVPLKRLTMLNNNRVLCFPKRITMLFTIYTFVIQITKDCVNVESTQRRIFVTQIIVFLFNILNTFHFLNL